MFTCMWFSHELLVKRLYMQGLVANINKKECLYAQQLDVFFRYSSGSDPSNSLVTPLSNTLQFFGEFVVIMS